MIDLADLLIRILDKESIRHKLYEFDSGIKVVDVWYGEEFYVFQFEEIFIGLSKIEDDSDLSFDFVPDEKLVSKDEFISKVQSVFNITIE